MTKTPYFLFLSMLLLSCEEAVDWEFQSGDNGQLVVEAIITNEFKVQTVRLSRSYNELNGPVPPVSGAYVGLREGAQTFPFSEISDQPGTYHSDQAFATELNKTYQLIILWEDQTYQAESEMVEVKPIPPIELDTIGQDSFIIDEVAPLYATDEQAMYELDIDWTHLIPGENNQAKLFFYTLSTVDVNGLIQPPREKVKFPKGSIIIEKKYALNDEFADYIRTFLMETDWQGGVYDENSSSLPTNISNDALGFFTVAAVVSDTLVAE